MGTGGEGWDMRDMDGIWVDMEGILGGDGDGRWGTGEMGNGWMW